MPTLANRSTNARLARRGTTNAGRPGTGTTRGSPADSGEGPVVSEVAAVAELPRAKPGRPIAWPVARRPAEREACIRAEREGVSKGCRPDGSPNRPTGIRRRTARARPGVAAGPERLLAGSSNCPPRFPGRPSAKRKATDRPAAKSGKEARRRWNIRRAGSFPECGTPWLRWRAWAARAGERPTFPDEEAPPAGRRSTNPATGCEGSSIRSEARAAAEAVGNRRPGDPGRVRDRRGDGI